MISEHAATLIFLTFSGFFCELSQLAHHTHILRGRVIGDTCSVMTMTFASSGSKEKASSKQRSHNLQLTKLALITKHNINAMPFALRAR
jgi:hypothetical protein